MPAQDSAQGFYVRGLDHQLRFVPHGGREMPGDVRVVVADHEPTHIARTRRMESVVKGLSRLK